MAIAEMKCRVCGKMYPPCRTAIKNPNVFHWQEVACSPECGEVYLQGIIESRRHKPAPAVEPSDTVDAGVVESSSLAPSPATAGDVGECEAKAPESIDDDED